MRQLRQLLQQTRRQPQPDSAPAPAGEHPNFWMYRVDLSASGPAG